jgi:hypothetical protein
MNPASDGFKVDGGAPTACSGGMRRTGFVRGVSELHLLKPRPSPNGREAQYLSLSRHHRHHLVLAI